MSLHVVLIQYFEMISRKILTRFAVREFKNDVHWLPFWVRYPTNYGVMTIWLAYPSSPLQISTDFAMLPIFKLSCQIRFGYLPV